MAAEGHLADGGSSESPQAGLPYINQLDQLSMMAEYDPKKPKAARGIGRQTGNPDSSQKDLLCFDWFCLSGFQLPDHWSEELTQAITAIHSKPLKVTYICRARSFSLHS